MLTLRLSPRPRPTFNSTHCGDYLGQDILISTCLGNQLNCSGEGCRWKWEVVPKNGGRWKVELKNCWLVVLAGYGRWTLKNDGRWEIGPSNRWKIGG